MEKEESIGVDKEVTPPLEGQVLEPKPQEKIPVTADASEDAKALEVLQKQEELANLNKAIADEQDRLRKIRTDQKKAKLGIEIDEEDELPQIDMKDPSAKAWDKRIRESSEPAQRELEKAKEERRLFTLRKFLADKPALSKNPAKIQAMMETYDRLKTSTELTNEGIEMDLEKAYAAEHSEELISLARQNRVAAAENDTIFSDAGVTRGSTSYSKEQPKVRVYSDEEKAILAKWNTTPEQQAQMEAEMKSRVG